MTLSRDEEIIVRQGERLHESKTRFDYFVVGLSTGLLAFTAKDALPGGHPKTLVLSWTLLLASVAFGILKLERKGAAQQHGYNNMLKFHLEKEVHARLVAQGIPAEEVSKAQAQDPLSDSEAAMFRAMRLQRFFYWLEMGTFFCGLLAFAIVRSLIVLDP